MAVLETSKGVPHGQNVIETRVLTKYVEFEPFPEASGRTTERANRPMLVVAPSETAM